jgi:RNA polymerase sigma-70 factor (sigma-E family)
MRDRSTFPEYARSRSVRLRRAAYLICRDWDLADDLLQTALAKAWAAWPRISGDPDPYVYRIMVNTRRSWWQRRWRDEIPTEVMPETAVGDSADDVDRRTVLWAALGQLSTRQRAIVVLRYFEDLTEQQVADILGCTTGTVKSHTHRALTRLRVDPNVIIMTTPEGKLT